MIEVTIKASPGKVFDWEEGMGTFLGAGKALSLNLNSQVYIYVTIY